MSEQAPASAKAKSLLRHASQRMSTADPVPTLGHVLDEALPLPVGSELYQNHLMLEPTFSETSARNLSFHMDTVDPRSANPVDRIMSATDTMRRMVHQHFGPQALRWFDSRSESQRAARPLYYGRGAFFGSGFDRYGLRESMVTYQWGSDLMDALPGPLFRMARIALETVPGLRPAFSTIRCGRSGGSQQLAFEVTSALPLSGLKPLMDRLGLGHQHASLLSTTALILGSRFTLPPGSAMITLRPTRLGVELRLDVDLDAVPDTPTQFFSLLRMALGERPRGLRALQNWLIAMTPEHYEGPGDLSVLSVKVRPDMPARIALFLRPAALHTSGETRQAGGDGEDRPASPPPPQNQAAAPAQYAV